MEFEVADIITYLFDLDAILIAAIICGSATLGLMFLQQGYLLQAYLHTYKHQRRAWLKTLVVTCYTNGVACTLWSLYFFITSTS